MDNSKIVDLAFNNECYRESIRLRDNEEYSKNSDALNEICENLCKNLSKEERDKILWDIFMAQGGIECAVQETFFNEGFRLGLLIGAQNFLK